MESGREQEALWLNALWLLAVNSPPSPLGWPLLWTYEPCRSVWRWETVQGLLIKYYSPLNGWRLASVGMLGLNLPPGQMCVCVCKECLSMSMCKEGRGGMGLLYMCPTVNGLLRFHGVNVAQQLGGVSGFTGSGPLQKLFSTCQLGAEDSGNVLAWCCHRYSHTQEDRFVSHAFKPGLNKGTAHWIYGYLVSQ